MGSVEKTKLVYPLLYFAVQSLGPIVAAKRNNGLQLNGGRGFSRDLGSVPQTIGHGIARRLKLNVGQDYPVNPFRWFS